MREVRIVRQQLILQGEYIQTPLLAVIEQEISQTIAGKISAELLIKRPGR